MCKCNATTAQRAKQQQASMSCFHLLKSLSCLVPKPTRYPCIDKSYFLIVYACNLLCRAKQSSYHSSVLNVVIKKKEEDLFGYISKHMSDKALVVAKELKNFLTEKQSQGVNDGALIHSSTCG